MSPRKPWWVYSRFYRILWALSSVITMIVLIIKDSQSNTSQFLLGGSQGYVCFTIPFYAIIGFAVGGCVVMAYKPISNTIERALGMSVSREDRKFALLGAGYGLLCAFVFGYSKSVGQPDSQAFLAALFMTPFLAFALFLVSMLLMVIVAFLREIKILP